MNKYITKISLEPKPKIRAMEVKNGEFIRLTCDNRPVYTVYDPINMTYTILSEDETRPIISLDSETIRLTIDNARIEVDGLAF